MIPVGHLPMVANPLSEPLVEVIKLPREVLDTAQRLGRIKVHIATVIGTVSPRMEPSYGLRALRRAREAG
jgi:hypothetical protein